MYDTIIIGTGPAGVTAAIYAVRREMKVLLIGKELGGQVAWAGEIENYPGFNSIGNYDLINRFSEHLKSAKVEVKTAEVKKVEKNSEGGFIVHTTKDQFQAKTIIIAMGLEPKRLAIKGETELSGKGVSYCANCDGPLFKGKVIAVVGGGNSALEAAELLSKIASKVYLVHRKEGFRGFEEIVQQIDKRSNIEVMLNTEVKELVGESKLERMKVFNNKNNSETELAVNGVFIEVGRIAHTDLVGELVERNEWKQIVIDEKCRTNTEGVFAAGDVTQVEYKQITVACGQGTIAALAAYQYLQAKEGRSGTILDRSQK